MRVYSRIFKGAAELDHQIEKFRQLHKAYQAANIAAVKACLESGPTLERRCEEDTL